MPPIDNSEITPATVEDLAAIGALLRQAKLPDADLTPAHTAHFLVARIDARIVGAVGLERFGRDGLLRSLVVDSQWRGAGLGERLTHAILAHARTQGLSGLTLLTTTAQSFFERFGFTIIDRKAVPEAVRASSEFSSLCPASAVCLRKSLVPRVLFVCVENANRSQMAEGFAHAIGGEAVEALSAGSRPSGQLNPNAVRLMAELGISIAAQKSKSLDDIGSEPFDAVVTMGCGDACPWVPATRRLDWALPDPKGMTDDAFRRVRDEIKQRVDSLLQELQK